MLVSEYSRLASECDVRGERRGGAGPAGGGEYVETCSSPSPSPCSRDGQHFKRAASVSGRGGAGRGGLGGPVSIWHILPGD